MDSEIKATLESGGRVIVRQRSTKRGLSFDTELCSRYIGLMAIAKAEKAGEIRVKNATDIPKGILTEYELATCDSCGGTEGISHAYDCPEAQD